jgi:hypothetical protein
MPKDEPKHCGMELFLVTFSSSQRPSGRAHKVDVLAEKSGHEILISLKWQQTSGTAEQQAPFEIICLAEAIRENSQFKRAYVVLGGPGWTLREFFVKKVQLHLIGNELVRVVGLDDFIALANSGKL